MCCEICPDYYDCENEGKIKENCCSGCPDYEECISEMREDFEEDYNIYEDFEGEDF
ncbi:MAG: hypothetical protein ABIK60_02035 [candidate division WOR-3 bacterium]